MRRRHNNRNKETEQLHDGIGDDHASGALRPAFVSLPKSDLVDERRPYDWSGREFLGGDSACGQGFVAHKSMTRSLLGCAQQTRTLPSAGLSSGSGS